MKIKFLSTLLLSLIPFLGFSQQDTLNFSVETLYTASNRNYLPHWISANRFGIINSNNADGLIRLKLLNQGYSIKKFKFFYGIDVIGKLNNRSYLHQGFLKFQYSFLTATVGKIEEVQGAVFEPLSTGSMGISNNARPIPKVELAVKEYTDLPFSSSILQFKGSLSHRWFEEDRYVQSPFLHEKSFYLKTKKVPFGNFHLGFVHYGVWGGTMPSGKKLPQRTKDYFLVFLAQGADEDYDKSNGGDIINAIGDHSGFYDFGYETKIREAKMEFYHQTFFEDGSGMKIWKNPDRLLGIRFGFKESSIVNNILYEFLTTIHQSGPGLPDNIGTDNYGYDYMGRDDYYNNFLYRTGWTYNGRVIGNSLFTTNQQGINFFGAINNHGVAIINNRIKAHHFGISGQPSENISYKFLATFSKNYGTHAGLYNGRHNWDYQGTDYIFNPPLRQFNFLLETRTKIPLIENLEASAAVAADVGEMSNNIGFILGLKFSMIKIQNSK
jgi:hypothetical protein